MRFKVGTAGIPHSTQAKNGETPTLAGIRTIRGLGLQAMELEFVERIYLDETEAKAVKKYSQDFNVILTAHAPYYINLGNPDKVEISEKILLHTLKIASASGVKSVAFHPAYYMNQNSDTVFSMVKKSIEKIFNISRERGYTAELRPETAGKVFQFGSLDELIRLCKQVDGLKMCIDFAHIYSRSKGEINGYDGWSKVLEKLWKELGDQALKDLHCHIEGIEFGSKGEIKHLNFRESNFDYKGLALALKKSGAEGILICESPLLEYDAILLMEELS